MDDSSTRLVVFLFGDPHILEGAEGSCEYQILSAMLRYEGGIAITEDRSSDPDRVLPFRRSDNLDFHARGCERSDFLLHTIRDPRVHCGTTGENNVSVTIKTIW
jgi:hypothetical protein